MNSKLLVPAAAILAIIAAGALSGKSTNTHRPTTNTPPARVAVADSTYLDSFKGLTAPQAKNKAQARGWDLHISAARRTDTTPATTPAITVGLTNGIVSTAWVATPTD